MGRVCGPCPSSSNSWREQRSQCFPTMSVTSRREARARWALTISARAERESDVGAIPGLNMVGGREGGRKMGRGGGSDNSLLLVG